MGGVSTAAIEDARHASRGIADEDCAGVAGVFELVLAVVLVNAALDHLSVRAHDGSAVGHVHNEVVRVNQGEVDGLVGENLGHGCLHVASQRLRVVVV